MNAKTDLNYAFALSRPLMWFSGVWPDPFISASEIRWNNVRLFIGVSILSVYVIIPTLMNMIRAWGNVTQMITYLSSINCSILGISKLFVTWYHSEKLRKLMGLVLEDWMISKNSQERDTMVKTARRGRILSFQCYLVTAISIVLYIWINFLRMYWGSMLQQQQRRLAYHYNYPYNSQKSPNYEITYLIQISCGMYVAVINCSIDSFVSTLLLHECAQIINLRIDLNDLVSELANRKICSSKFKEGLAVIITRHQYIIRNAKTIDDCYSTALFIHMLLATFQLCFETFQVFTIIMDNLDVSILKICFLISYAVFIIIILYTYCYTAEKLLTESTGIAYAAYECKWYELSANDAKNLMFIVYRSRIPLRLTAGKFGTFSMELFHATVKTAMGYLSVLLALRN